MSPVIGLLNGDVSSVAAMFWPVNVAYFREELRPPSVGEDEPPSASIVPDQLQRAVWAYAQADLMLEVRK